MTTNIYGTPFGICFVPVRQEQVKELIGIKESDTGLSQPSQWDLVSDKQMMQEEQPLQVQRALRCIQLHGGMLLDI